MLISLWHTLVFDPIYNGLVFFIDIVPGGDVGIAIILITILVKLIILPISIKAARTQVIMRELEPQLKEIKEKFKDKREEQARAMMALYKEAGLNPFASILLIFIQLPIIFALYWSVYSGGGIALPNINTDLLYAFVAEPTVVSMLFLGQVDIAAKSAVLALLAGVTQYIQGSLTLPKPEPRKEGAEPSMKEDFTRSMHMQMRYVMPVIIAVVAYYISAAIALYFVVSNLMAIAQEYVVRKYR